MKKIYVLDAFTHGHDAALKFAIRMGWEARECEIVFCGTHEALLKRLSEGPGYGVVPVSNSTVGEVTEVTNEIARLGEMGYRFEVADTMSIAIEHCLLVPKWIKSVRNIERVMSHEKAIAQCGRFLDAIGIPPDRRSRRDSTGNSAKTVSKVSDLKINIAAIASRAAAKAYGLKIIASGIQDNPDNRTLFQLLRNDGNVKPVTIGIIGINGRFGRTWEKFFLGLGCKVIGSDIGLPGLTNRQVVEQSDVVIISVFLKTTPLVIKSLAKYFRPDQLVFDIASVKGPAVKELKRIKANTASIHPMFAPEVYFDGQTIVTCSVNAFDSFWKNWFVNMLAKTGSMIKWSNPLEHDTYMGTVQASPQLANLINALLIMEMNVSVSESLTFTSPFYRVMFSLMGRLLSQDPDLYAGILMENPVTVPMLKRRIAIERRVLKIIEMKDRNSFRRLFKKARKHFGKGVAREANELFLRLISVTKTLYGRNRVILEFSKLDDNPGLLEKVSRAFSKRGINLLGINSVAFDEKHIQFVVALGQSKSSDKVRLALEEIERWKSPKVRVLN